MKLGFYPGLALASVRKNKRTYLPYILTCIGMIMMTYIILYLQTADAIVQMRGGGIFKEMLSFGGWIMFFFSAFFLFYTNSFLIRRRKKEFGLYNILGMGKKNLAVIVFWENLFIALFSFAAGILGGILFSKAAELGAVNIVKQKTGYEFHVSAEAVLTTCAAFSVIFLLIFLNTLRQIHFSSAISLLKSEAKGEKPPKANLLLGIGGVVILCAAYYIAVNIEDPLSALVWFFAAVLMVIAATYLLMIFGSVLMCRLLQRRKKYYYKAAHFVSISSMVYRMRRNGAGLASICILVTMVLVMISSTSALYIGEEDVLRARYPGEINASVNFNEFEELSGAGLNESTEAIKEKINAIAGKYGDISNVKADYKPIYITGFLEGNNVECDPSKVDDDIDYSGIYQFAFISLDDYNRISGTNEILSEEEALLYSSNSEYTKGSISFEKGKSYKIKKHLSECFLKGNQMGSTFPTIVLVVADAFEDVKPFKFDSGEPMYSAYWEYCFDMGLDADEETALSEEINGYLEERENGAEYIEKASAESRNSEREIFLSDFGGLLYLAIILSIIFIFAAVLIIYYKQISEGYEDQARFEIMQKVGMSKKEIRKSINSQILTVFFLPLICAGMHLAFAFPIIRKLLLLFNMSNTRLFVAAAAVSFMVFAIFYAIVYKITSNAYYNIVSGAKEE